MTRAPPRLDHRDRPHHPDRHRPRRLPGRAAGRAARRSGGSTASIPSPFRSQVAAQVDDFDPLAWMPPKTARQLDRFSQFGLVAGRLALDDAGLQPRAPTGRPHRSGSGSTSGRRWAGSPTPRSSTSGTSSAASGPSRRTSRWRCSAARRRPTSASPSTSAARSSRPRTPARPGRSRSARRSGDLREGRVDAAIAGGCEIPLSPLAFGAFDIIRALSAGHNDDPAQRRPAVRRRARRVRHGRGRGAAGPRGGGRRRAPRRDPLRRAARLRRDVRRAPHGPAARRRPEAARAASIALADAGVDPGEIDYVNAHASSTPLGDVAEARAIALALGDRAQTVPVSGTKALYGHPARRIGRHRGRDLRPGDPRRLGAGIGEPRRPGSGGRRAPARPAARGRAGDLPARALDVVRVRRAQRRARPGRGGPMTAEAETFSREAAAERAGVDGAYVDRLVDLGIIAPGDDGRFSAGAIQRVGVVLGLERSGMSMPLVGEAIESRQSLARLRRPAELRPFRRAQLGDLPRARRADGHPGRAAHGLARRWASPHRRPTTASATTSCASSRCIEVAGRRGLPARAHRTLAPRLTATACAGSPRRRPTGGARRSSMPLFRPGNVRRRDRPPDGGRRHDLTRSGDQALLALFHGQQANAWMRNIFEGFETVLDRDGHATPGSTDRRRSASWTSPATRA